MNELDFGTCDGCDATLAELPWLTEVGEFCRRCHEQLCHGGAKCTHEREDEPPV